MGFFVMLQEIVECRQRHTATGEISHEVGFEFGKVRGGMKGGRLESERRSTGHNNTGMLVSSHARRRDGRKRREKGKKKRLLTHRESSCQQKFHPSSFDRLNFLREILDGFYHDWNL